MYPNPTYLLFDNLIINDSKTSLFYNRSHQAWEIKGKFKKKKKKTYKYNWLLITTPHNPKTKLSVRIAAY